jgi:hypothetical protein
VNRTTDGWFCNLNIVDGNDEIPALSKPAGNDYVHLCLLFTNDKVLTEVILADSTCWHINLVETTRVGEC